MPKSYVHTEIDGRKVRLSNLDKILYPSVGISKAEIIQYYLENAHLIVPYIERRALTVIRFPDGVEGTSFYSKERPDWTPDWIGRVLVEHDDETKEYIQADTRAELVYLANLACLELHPMQYVNDGRERPDYFVFDLDPSETVDFTDLKEIAENLRNHLIKYNYTPFIKTSGGKGLHIFVPIQTNYSFDEMVASVKSLTREFVALYPSICTLELSKQKRRDKVLIDIYRNHRSNTTVAPYSLRGKSGAPVSMPFHWRDLATINGARHFHVKNMQAYLAEFGDPWQHWRSYAAPLHDKRSQVVVDVVADSRLGAYVEKRDLHKTPEPAAQIDRGHKNAYVIQWHDATNLHYDLRLEDDGVLLSWAIPKGLPYETNQKRLAIRTEDHPIEYLFFEGNIPKGQYGAGSMFIIDRGTVKWEKKSADKYVFSLSGDKYATRYNLFKTKSESQWIITADMNRPATNWPEPIGHMLAGASRELPRKSSLIYEVKWDGIRVFVYLKDDQVRLYSRNGNELTAQFPELMTRDVFHVEEGIFDGEIVVLDEQGRPQFADVISRMHSKGELSISKGVRQKPAVCYLFDMVRVDGRDVSQLPLDKRRGTLQTAFDQGQEYRFSRSFSDGAALLDAIAAKGMEGIMAKDPASRYVIGGRSDAWLKIKCRAQMSCFIVGYTEGNGDRAAYFGSFHVAERDDEGWIYRGKVGTGYDHETLKKLHSIFMAVEVVDQYIDATIEEASRTTWIQPHLRCMLEYASMTPNGTLREPVFIQLLDEEE